MYSIPAPAIPPKTYAIMYGINSFLSKRPPIHNQIDTAGFKWHPEM